MDSGRRACAAAVRCLSEIYLSDVGLFAKGALWSPCVSRLSRWIACPVTGPSSVVLLKVRWTAICVREELVCEDGRTSGDGRIWSKSIRCPRLETFRKGAQVLGVSRTDTVKEN